MHLRYTPREPSKMRHDYALSFDASKACGLEQRADGRTLDVMHRLHRPRSTIIRGHRMEQPNLLTLISWPTANSRKPSPFALHLAPTTDRLQKRDLAGSVASFGSAGLGICGLRVCRRKIMADRTMGLPGMLITVCSFLDILFFSVSCLYAVIFCDSSEDREVAYLYFRIPRCYFRLHFAISILVDDNHKRITTHQHHPPVNTF